jgi:hypothetical protein
MPQDQHFALIRRQCFEGYPQLPGAVRADGLTVVGEPDLVGRDGAAGANVVEGSIAGDPHDPGSEGHLALLVLHDPGHQLGEDHLADVFGLVLVVHDTGDISLNVRRKACVEEMESLTVAGLGGIDSHLNHPAVPLCAGRFRRARLVE